MVDGPICIGRLILEVEGILCNYTAVRSRSDTKAGTAEALRFDGSRHDLIEILGTVGGLGFRV